MPIYEFKCSACSEFFEVLVMKSDSEDQTVTCPACKSLEFERVVSRTNYTMGGASGSSAGTGVSTQERSCSGGSCKTYTIAGETR